MTGIRALLQILLLMSVVVCPLQAKGVPRTKGAGSRAGGSRKSGTYGSDGSSGFSSLPLLIRTRFSFLAKFRAYHQGIILASRDWRATHVDYSDSMTLCYSVRDDVPNWLNDSVLQPWYYRNRTVLGLYVCPVDSQLDKVYCCGPKDGQKCCTFWDDFSRLSSVVVGAVLAVVSCLAFAVWLYRWSKRHMRWKSEAASQVNLSDAMDGEAYWGVAVGAKPRKVGVRRNRQTAGNARSVGVRNR